jgi:hypothetical protein
MHKRRSIAWLVAVAVGLMLIPAAGASASDVSAAYNKKDKRAEKRQNARITRIVKGAAKLGKTVSAQGTAIAGANAAILAEGAKSNDIDARLKVIEGAAPQIIKGLGDLKDGLTALKTGLETAGAGLTSLKTLVTSTEYGIGQVYFGATPQSGSFVVTPNIPDDVQQAQTTQVFNAGAGSGVIHVLVGVRSNESDGDGTVPAAHCRVTVVDDLGHTTTSKPTAAGAGIGTAPFYPILTKSTVTSTTPANAGFPFGQKASAPDADTVIDLTDTGGSGNAVAPDTTAATATATKSYTVSLTCVDLSPSPTDPSA